MFPVQAHGFLLAYIKYVYIFTILLVNIWKKDLFSINRMLNKYLDYTKLKSNNIYPQVLKKESHYKIWYGGHL